MPTADRKIGDLVELIEPVDDAPAGARGGVLSKLRLIESASALRN
jgi:hypothetical protein